MTDNPEQPERSRPTPDDATNLGSEQDLDEALLRASELAENIAAEVGREAAPSAASPRSAGAPIPDFDAALSELESLVAETDRQVDGETEGSSSTPSGAHAAPNTAAESDPDANYEVPDFMAEFMEPEPPKPETKKPARPKPPPPLDIPQPASVAPASATTISASKPGVIGTGMLGVVGGEVAEPPSAHDIASTPPKAGRHAAASAVEDAKTWSQKLIEPIEGPALKAATIVATTVELLDRPVALFGERGRRILGWIALATFGTAIVAYMASLL
jgi:hypothetical protein